MAGDARREVQPSEREFDEQGRPTLVAQSCLDFLMIEMVPMAQRISDSLYRRDLQLTGQLQDEAPLTLKRSNTSEHSPVNVRRTRTGGSIKRGKDQPKPQNLDEDELRESTYARLENLGHRVGLGAVESLSASAPLMYHPAPEPPIQQEPGQPPQFAAPQPASLEVIKFLCKELWQALFRKQIDNLKTNHRGTFVLTDNLFGPLKRCSLPSATSAATPTTDSSQAPKKKSKGKEDLVIEEIDVLPPSSTLYTGTGLEEATKQAQAFLAFPVGVVRGALAGLGAEAEVKAEVAAGGLPGVIVTVRTGVQR